MNQSTKLIQNEAKGLRATTLLSQSWKSDNERGSKREKSNIAIAIYPISHLNFYNIKINI